MSDPYLEYLEKKDRLRDVEMTDDEIVEAMIRTSGELACEVCGKNLYSHPFVSNIRDIEGHPFLHVTCSGEIVKL